jgi:hypothetical protein
MTSVPIVSRLPHLPQMSRVRLPAITWFRRCPTRPCWQEIVHDPACLPTFVRESPVAMRYLRLLGPLDWDGFPERDLHRYRAIPPVPYTPFTAACLIKLDQGLAYVSRLRDYLIDHPPLIWLLGFPLAPSRQFSWGFDPDASLPTARHFTRMLREIPNPCLQFLLDDTVCLLQADLASEGIVLGKSISLDTKHIIAWVQENNAKAYVKEGRYDKTKQPKGDPDCRLGCKRRTNQAKGTQDVESLPTPTTNPVSAKKARVGEFYWGYGSGIVATKVPGWGEFVLAELTQPFDQSDVSYFKPLMAETERRLDRQPRFGAFDAAFDAFYVYEYFHQEGGDWTTGFAAVPFVGRGGQGQRSFSDDGLPLCSAGLPMPQRYTFWCKTTLIPHERARYVCPLRYPEPTGDSCPVQHKNWAKNGCVTTMATSPGARIRYQIDRDSELYKQVYKQRTASERVNSQATELGIERPKLRNGRAIANENTLIYILINLRGLHRVRQHKAGRVTSGEASAPES